MPDTLPLLAADLRVVLGRLLRVLRDETGTGGLSSTQLAVLKHLERHGSTTMTDLARVERMRPQSMSPVVAGLEQLGHVQGAPDPKDGRRVLLSLTAACRQWIRTHRAARDEWLIRAIQTRLSPAEQNDLARGVALLGRLTEEES